MSEPIAYPKMESKDRLAMFESCLSLIQDPDVKELVKQCLMKAPNYFFYMPASTSGKHHNKDALGIGGLARHTKMLVNVAKELIRLDLFKDVDYDCAIASCILHDTCKCGYADDAATYEFEHPLLAAARVEQVAKSIGMERHQRVRIIAQSIASHMGQWNFNHDSENKKWLPKPKNINDHFVHLCDYLASRKTISVISD